MGKSRRESFKSQQFIKGGLWGSKRNNYTICKQTQSRKEGSTNGWKAPSNRLNNFRHLRQRERREEKRWVKPFWFRQGDSTEIFEGSVWTGQRSKVLERNLVSLLKDYNSIFPITSPWIRVDMTPHLARSLTCPKELFWPQDWIPEWASAATTKLLDRK